MLFNGFAHHPVFAHRKAVFVGQLHMVYVVVKQLKPPFLSTLVSKVIRKSGMRRRHVKFCLVRAPPSRYVATGLSHHDTGEFAGLLHLVEGEATGYVRVPGG